MNIVFTTLGLRWAPICRPSKQLEFNRFDLVNYGQTHRKARCQEKKSLVRSFP